MRNETSQGQEDNEEENLKEEVILDKGLKTRGYFFFLTRQGIFVIGFV